MRKDLILAAGLAQRPLVRGVRAAVNDHAAFDAAARAQMTPVTDHSPLWGARHAGGIGIDPGQPLGYGVQGARGGVQVMDSAGQVVTVDSTGAFLVGELERLDQKMHEPLSAISWSRDVDVREDVTIADEVSSFTLSTFAAAGSLGAGNGIGNGKAWINKTVDQIAGVSVDISKVPQALTPWAMELKYDILELESSAKVGRPIDQQKFAGLKLKNQMDTDEQAYFGDTSLGVKGLVNNAGVTVTGLPNGAAGTATWATKTPDEVLSDVNLMLTTVWEAAAWAQIPKRILLPTTAYGAIATRMVSIAGAQSILSYIKKNNLLATSGEGELEVFACKWCNGTGAGGTPGTGGQGFDRAVVYTKDYDRVRFPLTLLQRTPLQYDGLYHKTTYFCRLGVVEIVYPDTFGYFDGLS